MTTTPAQAKVLRRLAAGERIRMAGMYGHYLGQEAISSMTVRVLRRRGLIERSGHGYEVTEAGKVEAKRLAEQANGGP